MRFSVACWLSLVIIASAPVSAWGERGAVPQAAPDLEALLKHIATTSGVEASYRESKELSLLAAPLESRGVIYFVPPDRFARFTLEPGFSSLVVDGDTVRAREGRTGDEMDLSASPVARGFVESFMVLWRGDPDELRRFYELEPVKPARASEDWDLRLVPRHPPLSRVIRAIHLRGDSSGMRSMTVQETDGDRTVTRFEQIQTARAYSEAELRRLFETHLPLSGLEGAAPGPDRR